MHNPHGASNSPATVTKTWHDDGKTILATLPSRPQQLDAADLTVTIRDPDGHPASGDTVFAVLSMPSMTMPDDRVALTPVQGGGYRGQARFTMAGSWRVTIEIRDRNGHSSTFPIDPVVVE